MPFTKMKKTWGEAGFVGKVKSLVLDIIIVWDLYQTDIRERSSRQLDIWI